MNEPKEKNRLNIGSQLLYVRHNFTIRLGNRYVSTLARLFAIAKEMIRLVPFCWANGASSPRFLKIGAYPEPLVKQFSTETILNSISIMRETPPRLLTQCVVGCFHLFQRKASAIWAVRFSSSTPSIDDIIHSGLISWIDTHLIPFTMVQFDNRFWVKDVVVVRDKAFKRKQWKSCEFNDGGNKQC